MDPQIWFPSCSVQVHERLDLPKGYDSRHNYWRPENFYFASVDISVLALSWIVLIFLLKSFELKINKPDDASYRIACSSSNNYLA